MRVTLAATPDQDGYFWASVGLAPGPATPPIQHPSGRSPVSSILGIEADTQCR